LATLPHRLTLPSPAASSDLVKCFIDPELRRWPNIQDLYGEGLRRTKVFGPAGTAGAVGDVEEDDKHAKGESRWKVLHDRIVEHVCPRSLCTSVSASAGLVVDPPSTHRTSASSPATTPASPSPASPPSSRSLSPRPSSSCPSSSRPRRSTPRLTARRASSRLSSPSAATRFWTSGAATCTSSWAWSRRAATWSPRCAPLFLPLARSRAGWPSILSLAQEHAVHAALKAQQSKAW